MLLKDNRLTTISIPAPVATCLGLNDDDVIVGGYGTARRANTGFVYANGVLSTLLYPGSKYTIATSINNSGTVVGYFGGLNEINHGFLYTPSKEAH
jgi:probable HAF family extracellular repeat protein